MLERYVDDSRRKNNRVGETNTNNDGYEMTIVEYNNANDIIVEFKENKYQKRTTYKNFKNGVVKNDKKHVGEIAANNFGLTMKIIEYNRSDDVFVEFEDGEIVHTTYTNFKNGNIKHPKNNQLTEQAGQRLGDIRKNFQGCDMQIVSYKNRNEIEIMFLDEHKYKTKTIYKTFVMGAIRNPYFPSLYNIGAIGRKYPTTYIDGSSTKEYSTWNEMFKRCYSANIHKKRPRYIGCTVCDEWKLYENFYEWMISQENYKTLINEPRCAIDKDILVKHNKIYSPNTCCLVPLRINNLFSKDNSMRGEYPIGVSYHNATNMFQAQCNNGFINKYLGIYNTPLEAFNAYKQYKETLIKQVAKEYFEKQLISKKCFEAMMNYKVEIDD